MYTTLIMCPSGWVVTKPLLREAGGLLIFKVTFVLSPSRFCKIWALCVSWVTYDLSYMIFYDHFLGGFWLEIVNSNHRPNIIKASQDSTSKE